MARSAGLVLALGGAVALGWGLGRSAKHAQADKAAALAARAGKPAAALPATPAVKPAEAAKPSAKRRSRRVSSSTAAHLTMPDDAAAAPAVRYGQLSQDACEAELARRDIGFVREAAVGVVAPVRLTGALHGVEFRTDQPARQRPTSPYEVADCRLVLALDDFAAILRTHAIVEVRHYSMWRPPRGFADGQIGKRHDGALALDAGRFITSTGAELDVDRDFHGAIDARTCGPGAAPKPATPAALELRAILCEAVDQRLFNVVLTPNYNRPHKNHFHLEVTAGVTWFLVH